MEKKITLTQNWKAPDMDLYLKKIEMLNIPIENLITEHSKALAKSANDYLENMVRTYAIPPIKGEITAGKIKWRGIRLCNCMDGLESYQWIEQRGKILGNKIKITGMINPQDKD